MLKKILMMTALLCSLLAQKAMAQEVNLYSMNTIQKIELLNAELKKNYNIKLNVVTGSTGVLMRRIEAESSNPKGDFVWSATANTMAPFGQFFERYQPVGLSEVPDSLKLPDTGLIPVNLQLVTVMVNADMLDGLPVPKTWKDLADPIYKGKIIITDPVSSSTGYSVTWGLSKLLDKATYEKIVSNFVLSNSSQAVPRAVALGEYPIGIIYEFGAYEYIAGGQSEIKLVYPEDGTFIAPEYAAIIKDAKNLDSAKKTIDMLLSKDVQTLFLEKVYMRPVRTDIKVSDYLDLPDLDQIKIFPIDEIKAFNGRDEFLKNWNTLPKAK